MSIEKFKGKFTNESNGCTTLINSTIQNIKDFTVLGLYVYLCSKPDSWEPNYKELMFHTTYSKGKVYKLLNKLIELNLMTVQVVREKGRFLHNHYFIHLHPLKPFLENEEMDTSLINTDVSPFPQKRDPIQPETVKMETYITKRNTKQIINKTNKDLLCENENTTSNSSLFEYQETYYPINASIESSVSIRFEEFWELYPNKKNKSRARAMWEQSCLDEKADEILNKLKMQIKEETQWKDIKYIPNPSNYLNEERWTDEITPKADKQQSVKNYDHVSTDWIKSINQGLLR